MSAMTAQKKAEEGICQDRKEARRDVRQAKAGLAIGRRKESSDGGSLREPSAVAYSHFLAWSSLAEICWKPWMNAVACWPGTWRAGGRWTGAAALGRHLVNGAAWSGSDLRAA